MFFKVFLLLFINIIELCFQFFEPFLIRIRKRGGGGEFLDFILEIWV